MNEILQENAALLRVYATTTEHTTPTNMMRELSGLVVEIGASAGGGSHCRSSAAKDAGVPNAIFQTTQRLSPGGYRSAQG